MQQSLKTAEMHLQISHDTPASMVGTTRSRITYFMNRFRQRGLIDYKGSVMFHPSRLDAALQDG